MPRDRYDDDEDDDRPRRSRRRRRDDYDDFDRPKKGGMSGGLIALLVVGICVVVLAVCGGVIYAVAMPAFQKVGEAKARMEAQNNLKQTSLAQLNFESSANSFSRPFLDTDQQGTNITPPTDPANRLSWRVAMLPFLADGEGASAYSRFNIREGWNSTANLPMKDVPIRAYRHPLDAQDKGEPTTRTRCFYDNGALFESKPHSRIGFLGVTDGLSNTIMLVESTDTVTWTAFNDYRYEPNAPLPALGHPKTSANGFQVAYVDGSVRYVRPSASQQAIKAAITRAGGEVGMLD